MRQLHQLKENLRKFKQASIVGTSGIGKTQLIRTFAYENRSNYKVIWFVDCNLNLNQEFIKLAKELNKNNGANIKEGGNLVKEKVLEYLQKKDNWLLIFDNLKIGENKKVQDFINWEHNGHVIFASQDKENLPYSIELTKFNRNDSIILANNILESSSSEQEEFLAKSFNGYPILIVQAAQLLNQVPGLNFKTYKKQVLRSSNKLKLNIALAISEFTPTAVNLLYKMALINNQAFSKDFLSYITDNKTSLEDDIFQISKFALISNISSSEQNSIFEMHDIIAQTIIDMNGRKKSQDVLEKLISNLLKSVPRSVTDFHVFRSGKTIFENFKVISRYTEEYPISLFGTMGLSLYLMTQYNNYSDYEAAEELVKWFNEREDINKFNPSLMNNDERARYADFLQSLARHYRNRHFDFDKSMKYAMKAKEVYKNVEGYESIKADLFYQLASNEIKVGNMKSAEQYIVKLKNTPFINNVESMLFFLKGDYESALNRMSLLIKIRLGKIKADDLVLTSNYLLRAKILNFLGRYQEAYDQAKQIYNMHKFKKKEDHLIFGRIFAELARSELGLGKIADALEHIKKSISILKNMQQEKAQKARFLESAYLARSYVVQGEIFMKQNCFKDAIEFYRAAQKIYFYLYKNNMAHIEHVSYLHLQGAKAACRAGDLYHYKTFGEPQVRGFGQEHPNTIAMFKYCGNYNMNLWQ
ncbi:MAG: hypothetical protein COA94_03025 [Rickettsiales bacterium]|nr:MAG: hypothetical protein COA94_03025 [Rickettsiales bacterium]